MKRSIPVLLLIFHISSACAALMTISSAIKEDLLITQQINRNVKSSLPTSYTLKPGKSITWRVTFPDENNVMYEVLYSIVGSCGVGLFQMDMTASGDGGTSGFARFNYPYSDYEFEDLDNGASFEACIKNVNSDQCRVTERLIHKESEQ